ncbi:MAG: Maf family protein [Isosphaeraceae bacterium]
MSGPAAREGEKNLPEVVLASTSPYRRALLERLCLPFRCLAPRFDEDAVKAQEPDPRALAEQLAFAKAASLLADEPEAAIIGCDQLVAFQGRTFGKPGSADQAVEQLSAMAGQTHDLYTALVVVHRERVFRYTDVTTLRMRSLSRPAIKRYVSSDQPVDCAGSYKLESRGIVLFDRIQTDDHSAITGLPLVALVTILCELGFEIP